MKKIIILSLGLVLLAAACNKTTDDNNNNTTPPPSANTPTPTPAPTTPTPTPSPTAATEATVTYTASGYSPSPVTIKKGGKVTFVNNSSSAMWPASAPHPSHTDYAGFDPKQGIIAGSSWTFTFDKVGTWSYHDHLNPTKFGKITVVE
jgi:plastocyanin